MTNHCMVVDDFFSDPTYVKYLIDKEPMIDHLFSDGVTYPNIVRLPQLVEKEIADNAGQLFGPSFKKVLSFARYSFGHTKPPHWAHSDRNIAQLLLLIYLNDSEDAEEFGTATLRHKTLKFEKHPDNDAMKEIILKEANKKDAWEITFNCPARFNRALFLNADLIHAAMGEYGKDRSDGRLVITVFFDLE